MHRREKLRRIPIGMFVFVGLGAGLGVAGWEYYQWEARQFKRSAGEELTTIAGMKVHQIDRWRRERGHDAEMLIRAPVVRTSLDTFLRGEAPARLPRNTAEFLEAFREHHGYEQIVGLDRGGRVRFSLPGGARKLEAQCAAAAEEALRTGAVAFSDLHRAAGDSGAHLCIATSIPQPGGRGPAAGTVVLRMAPERFLYPLIQSWPAASRTGETLLVRRDGDEVVYLNELRHRKGTALKLRLPVAKEGLVAGMAVQGRTALMEGRDYRGVAVLAAVLPVPGTRWHLVAKVDLAEVHAPWRARAWWLSAVVGLLLAAAGTAIAFLWRHQRAAFHRRQFEAEQQHRRVLETALDGFAMLSTDGRFVEVNDAFRELMGYSRGELLGMRVQDIEAEFTPEQVRPQVSRIMESGGLRFESRVRRKDGRIIAVEISTTFLPQEGGRLVLFVRDVTERKRVEERIRILAELVDISPASIVVHDFDGNLLFANQRTLEYHGYSMDEFMRLNLRDLDVPESAAQIAPRMRLLAQRGETSFEAAHFRKDGSVIPLMVNARVTRWGGREVILSVATDLTEHYRAEEALRESQEALARSREELRALAASLLSAQEQERQRVSRELHDDLNQRLAVLAMQVDMLGARLPLSVEELRRELESLARQVAGLSDDVRRMASRLHPSVLEHLGLAAALRSHCEQFSSREGIPIEFEERGVPAELSPEVALCLYRIAQEALHNLARHARARRGSVTLSGSEGGIELSISDDGEGFDPRATRARGGLGLLSMEERARLVGGTLAIRSSPGQGTLVEARVPAR